MTTTAPAGPDGDDRASAAPGDDNPRVDVDAGNNAYIAFGDQTNIGRDLNVYPALPPPLPEPARCTLPRDTTVFTGRGGELSRITDAVRHAADTSGIVAIHAIDGMPGIGKTALAVHAAHQLADRFPDGQLFLDLHAHTPGLAPTDPAGALATLLVADGVDARYLPSDLDGRAAMWRDRMAAKTVLLVLDNAASTSQVQPLLPGNPACLTLITSRRQLGDLPGRPASLRLDQLSDREAQDMFIRSAERPVSDPAAVGELVDLCGYLPLAIAILARVYTQHPSWTMADLIAETRDSVLRLSAEQTTVTAAFDISMRYLPATRRRFLTLLGLHPGTSIDPYAAAALTATSLDDATAHLDGLWRDNLLTETGRRRYGMHDLIRAYTRDLAATLPEDEREQALDRVLDYYQHTATRAATILASVPRPDWAATGATRFAAPPVDDHHPTALAWTRTERPNLHACLDHATDTDQPARIVALTAALAPILRTDGPWIDAVTLHSTAAQTAQRLGDRLGQANALNDLGIVRRLTTDYPGATSVLEQALDLLTTLGRRLGQANALRDLGDVRRASGDYPSATTMLEQALDLYTTLGDRLGQANALTDLGVVRRLTDDYPGATTMLEQALDLYTTLGNRLGQANALQHLGVVRRQVGDYPGATSMLEQSLDLLTTLGDRLGQANALRDLGACGG
ncbi:tetratricopeptide repeat protein [Phytohabitans flavus]|uniref:Uncharacterized protein n=1 Tax=Phytohabitans flavus TaxID=1076124 RepID=A0A6F8XSZ8_9ACTN|nr:tetratricopeptide repeat protein [Phytohabitans flavus]BCB76919.1 hypothetical protein Pflav_033290 [Phytohabitans flavus]